MEGFIATKILKQGKTYYPVIYTGIDPLTKKKSYKWGDGFLRKRDAAVSLNKMAHDFDTGDLILGSNITFGEIYDQWIELIAPEQYKSIKNLKTAISYSSNHILPIFSKIKIDKIESQHIQRFFFNIKSKKKNEDGEFPPLSSSTKKKILSIISSVFKQAIIWNMLSKNPCEKVKLQGQCMVEFSTWNMEQLNYFLSSNTVVTSKYYLGILIAATTGLRRGEICGLKWKDYNGKSFFTQRGLDVYFNDTGMKNTGSHRRIELMQILKDVLGVRSVLCNNNGNNYIVVDENCKVLNPDTLSYGFRALIKKINKESEYELPIIRFHDLRHSMATCMLENDVNTKVVSEILGHSSTAITSKIYQHVTKTMHGNAINKYEETLFSSPK